ncbi:MAG: T9SS type A sorting domain-containing protein, partial [Ignavibacteria bacterium]|nr:T9SS type A sorting domain-containing protein [Ignavibacteria bacterium]
PFNPSTTIRYSLGVDSPVSVRVYNMLGQEVATLVDGFQKAGEQSIAWHGVNNLGQAVASGLYVYRIQAGNTVMTQKMLFTK